MLHNPLLPEGITAPVSLEGAKRRSNPRGGNTICLGLFSFARNDSIRPGESEELHGMTDVKRPNLPTLRSLHGRTDTDTSSA